MLNEVIGHVSLDRRVDITSAADVVEHPLREFFKSDISLLLLA